MKCDQCQEEATVHLVEIKDGQKHERHLCETHAIADGISVQIDGPPMDQLLEKFILEHSGSDDSDSAPSTASLRCHHCDTSFASFKKQGLLGCPDCYISFEAQLIPIIQQTHAGADQHYGKVPTKQGAEVALRQRLLYLRRELDAAIASEEYERAAALRDDLMQTEAQLS